MSVVRNAVVSVLNHVGTDSALGRRMLSAGVRARGATLKVAPEYLCIRKRGHSILLRREHLILAPEVAKAFDSVIAAVRPVQGDPMTLDFRTTNLFRYAPLERDLYFCGFPDLIEPDTDYLKHFGPRPGDIAFDLGANAGVVTLALADRVGPTGRVVAVEPDPSNFDALVRNTAGLGNVTCLNIAIATTSGEAEYIAEGGVTSHLAEVRGQTVKRDAAGSTVTCRTEPLDALIAREGVPTFAKIDIEGMEIPVLAKDARLLASHGVRMALDTHHPLDDGYTKDPVEQILADAGYRAWSAKINNCWMTWAEPA